MTYRSHARTPLSIALFAAIWGALILGYVLMDLTPLIILPVVILTLPLAWDLWRNPESGLDITNSYIYWFSGAYDGKLNLTGIQKVRITTRLDLSLRVTLERHEGKAIRLPPPCVPPGSKLENALHAAGIPVDRHHFSLTMR